MDMNAIAGRYGSGALAGATVLASLLAGSFIGLAITVSTPIDPAYVLGGIAAAIPVGLVLAGVTLVRPQVGLLALIEVVVFATAFLVWVVVPRAPYPLGVALATTLVAGAVAVLGRHARLLDVIVALWAGWLAVAVIYEVGVPLHNLL